MEVREPRPGFSLDALIAEAKRRARRRRGLILLLLVVVAAAAVGVTFGSSGGGSRPGGGAGKVGSPSNGSHSVQVGSLWVSVPRRFQVLTGSPQGQLTIRSVIPQAKNKTHAELMAAMANGVELDIEYLSPASARQWKRAHLPLERQELHLGDARAGRTWNGLVSGGGSVYSVILYMGKRATAADRAAILRALGSVRRSR
ncbi:MAG: hypothetical protein ACRDLM_03660 [Gaiellaceae bacterium]